jgi:hypothetical protein
MFVIVVSDNYVCKCEKWSCRKNSFTVESFGPFETKEEAEKIIENDWWEDDDDDSFISIDIIEVKQPQNFKNPIDDIKN